MMKKLFTTLILMGVALCTWAAPPVEPISDEHYENGVLTIDYSDIIWVDEHGNNLQNPADRLVKEGWRNNVTRLVLTGNFTNKDFEAGGIVDKIVARATTKDNPGQEPTTTQLYLDLSQCSGIYSKIQYTGLANTPDWTSGDFKIISSSETVPQPVQKDKLLFENGSLYTGSYPVSTDAQGNKYYTRWFYEDNSVYDDAYGEVLSLHTDPDNNDKPYYTIWYDVTSDEPYEGDITKLDRVDPNDPNVLYYIQYYDKDCKEVYDEEAHGDYNSLSSDDGGKYYLGRWDKDKGCVFTQTYVNGNLTPALQTDDNGTTYYYEEWTINGEAVNSSNEYIINTIKNGGQPGASMEHPDADTWIITNSWDGGKDLTVKRYKHEVDVNHHFYVEERRMLVENRKFYLNERRYNLTEEEHWYYTETTQNNGVTTTKTILVDNDDVYEENGNYFTDVPDPAATKFTFGFNSKSNVNGVAFPTSTYNTHFDAIPDDLCLNLSNLASVDFGADILWIGKRAFKNCPKLANVVIPNNLKVIDENSFDGCKLITSIDLANKDLRLIGGQAFIGTNITSFTGNAALEVIGHEAFQNIKTLGIVNLESCTNLRKIEFEAFELSGMSSITFPEGETLTFIGNDAFKETNLSTVDMSMCEGITEFQSKDDDGKTYKTFYKCESLTSITLPPYLTAVPKDAGMGMFQGCNALEHVIFTGTAVYENCVLQNPLTIGDQAFQAKYALSDIQLSNNVSSIGVESFSYAAIEEIHIPASVEELKKHSFLGCQKLTKVYFDAFDTTCGDCVGAATNVAGKEGSGGQGHGAFQTCQHITDVYINTMAELDCDNNAFDQLISWGAGDADGNFATLHFPKSKTEHYVNMSHYLTDAIVADPGEFHKWLEKHYDQAINPHKNGWYEFINSGPTDPDDKTPYEDIVLRTFSDWQYSYLVPNGLRAYVVKAIAPTSDGVNFEVTLQRIRVIPAQTGVILYGHPNGTREDGSKTLVLTPVNYLKHGDPIYEDANGTIHYDNDGNMIPDHYYQGESQGMPLRRDYWNHSSNYVRNYLMPIITSNGKSVEIYPYEREATTKKVKYRNFVLARFTSTDYYKLDTSVQDDFKQNFVGFFRLKHDRYASGYAYLQLRGDVDENGKSLLNTDGTPIEVEVPVIDPETGKEKKDENGNVITTTITSEYSAATGGEIFVKPDKEYNANMGIYPYNWEIKISDGKPFDASAAVGSTSNPKGWWDPDHDPSFTWEEPTKSWGDRKESFKSTATTGNNVFNYFGELEEDADGVVKLVIPANVIEDGEYYTLQGVRVTNPTTKGVYIHNGKKVIIK